MLSENMEPIVIPVTVSVSSAKAGGFESSGKGILELSPKGWLYKGEINGEEIERFFPIDTVPAIPFDPNLNFQIYGYGKHHSFSPYENMKACIQYSNIGECAYQMFASEVMITKFSYETN